MLVHEGSERVFQSVFGKKLRFLCITAQISVFTDDWFLWRSAWGIKASPVTIQNRRSFSDQSQLQPVCFLPADALENRKNIHFRIRIRIED